MRVTDMRGDVHLAEKAIPTDCRGELRVQNFYRDLALVLSVIGEKHSRHSTAAYFARDGVPVSQDGSKTFEEVSHCS